MPEIIQTIARDLVERPLGPEWKGARIRVTQVAEQYRSKIARLTLQSSAGELKMIVKFAADRDVKHEYDLLTHVGASMPSESSVPRALRLYESFGALVMEECAGIPLTKWISRWSWLGWLQSDSQRVKSVVEACANLLRHFHSLTDIQTSVVNPLLHNESSEVVSRLESLDTSWPVDMPTSTRAELRHRTESRFNKLADAEASYALTHQDFASHNVLISGSHVTLLDLADARAGYPEEDVARFLVDVETLAAGLVPTFRRRIVGDVRASFIRSYGRKLDAERLSLFEFKAALMILLTIQQFRANPRFSASWHARAARHLAGRILEWPYQSPQ